MINYNFAIFILSHGRAKNQVTLNTIRNKMSYSGKVYLVCDDQDDQLDDYKSLSGVDDVLIFNKQEAAKDTDTFGNFNNFGSVVFARNATWEFAKNLDLDYFLELDDDYSQFHFRYLKQTAVGPILKSMPIKDFDTVVNVFLDFLSSVDNIYSLSFAMPGDFIGGTKSKMIRQGFKRRCLNTFFCSTRRYFPWKSLVLHDLVASTLQNSIGHIFISCSKVGISQPGHAESAGGFTDLYKAYGYYHRSFYLFMAHPSSTEITLSTYPITKITHVMHEKYYSPQIIPQRFQKLRSP